MPSEKSILLLFLRCPESSAAKPRLAEAFGPETAALIYRRLVRDLFEGLQALDSSFVLRILLEQPGNEAIIRGWVHELWHPSAPRPQMAPPFSGNWGERVRHAFREAFAEGFERVFAIGSSFPSITASTLHQAKSALDQSDAVFGPSVEGGCYLIGCSRFEPRLFDVSWDSDTALRTGLLRAAESGMTTRQLPPLPRVETVPEWESYKSEILSQTPPPSTPIVFRPIYQERIWGDRALETRLGRSLPPERKIGESWELVDRPEAQSLISEGSLMGFTLGDLWKHRRTEIFGAEASGERFPLILKILDAEQDLSLQVHPPERVAGELGGEPKTEMWYVAAAAPGARIYAGLRPGVTPEAFREALQNGTATALVHSVEPIAGDVLFIPSGRLHAIGAGLLIFEIQQNSDTTYRVFDWNRTGEDGQPRKLHMKEALRSIDFRDVEPSISRSASETQVLCPKFRVRRWNLQPHQTRAANDADRFAIITVVEGAVQCGGRKFREGDSFLIPASATNGIDLRAGEQPAVLLHTSIPSVSLGQLPRRAEVPSEHATFYQGLRSRIVAWAESKTGGRPHPWLDYILLAPDFFLLLTGLVGDRAVPAKLKTLLVTAIAYFVMPLDLFPEGFLGPIGYLDDIALAAFAISQLLSHVDASVIRRHWAGEGDILVLIQTIIARIDDLIGSGLVQQIRKRLRL